MAGEQGGLVRKQNGDAELREGFVFDILGTLKQGGVAMKFARGEAALDGSNPTPVDTGLTTIVAFVAMLKGSTAPGDGTIVLSATVAAGVASVYGWKNTSGSDPTLVASDGTESFFWIAIGT